MNARNRAWAARHPDRRLAAQRHWRKVVNPERARQLNREDRARRRAAERGNGAEVIDLAVVFERDEGICGICKQPVDVADWHLDHIIPISKGGPHRYDNVRVTHPRCNLQKKDKLDDQLQTPSAKE